MTRAMRWAAGTTLVAGVLVLWGGSSGCATDEMSGASRAPAAEAVTGPVETGAADRTEVDLVQETVMHRAMYARYLRVLASYYSEHGYETKAAWAQAELRELKRVRPYRYIMEDTSGAKENDESILLTSLENPDGANLPTINTAGRSELDLVEEMMMHRSMYGRLLRALATRHYSERGLENKANWARSELNDFQRIKPYRYVNDSESPQAGLKPRESIAEADKLYAEAHELMKKGGHRVPIFYSDTTMRQALAKFKELVEKYPTSDKVAEAAYYIGELHKEYNHERDNIIAVEWYQRAVEWDPDLNHPAWSHAAHVLDFRMHEREKALEWYQKVLEKEEGKKGAAFLGNIACARKRIKQLTDEETRYAPGEPIPAGYPAQTEPPVAGHAVEASPPPANVP